MSTNSVTPIVSGHPQSIKKSNKLAEVCYDIRGPVLKEAQRLEEEGHTVLKLNIGNPAPWGFSAPEEIIRDVIHNIPESQGYSDAKGIYSARKAVMQYTQQIGIKGVDIEDIYIGNGVSELVVMAMQALLNDGDEVLIPAPDFPPRIGSLIWLISAAKSHPRQKHSLSSIRTTPPARFMRRRCSKA